MVMDLMVRLRITSTSYGYTVMTIYYTNLPVSYVY